MGSTNGTFLNGQRVLSTPFSKSVCKLAEQF
jgi:pSer/pThr/pTyr-binding forkhead associated (FHA) protein